MRYYRTQREKIVSTEQTFFSYLKNKMQKILKNIFYFALINNKRKYHSFHEKMYIFFFGIRKCFPNIELKDI